ncbi:hypothetical protein F2Q69_00013274 [Brassica cretica]|uniref:Uncharacterized protein n=1 Tax=Brassica cretica TaxID=69181 RepID=A0A8S9QPZ8_BRACR|nr:hypothetical protein F2Q69_00013274 [Brassica cretica]
MIRRYVAPVMVVSGSMMLPVSQAPTICTGGASSKDEVDGEEEKSPSFCRLLVIKMKSKKTAARTDLTRWDPLEDEPAAVRDGMRRINLFDIPRFSYLKNNSGKMKFLCPSGNHGCYYEDNLFKAGGVNLNESKQILILSGLFLGDDLSYNKEMFKGAQSLGTLVNSEFLSKRGMSKKESRDHF